MRACRRKVHRAGPDATRAHGCWVRSPRSPSPACSCWGAAGCGDDECAPLDPQTATRDEVNDLNQEIGGALNELGISAQGAEIESPSLDVIFASQVPGVEDDPTPDEVRDLRASLAAKEDAGEQLEREAC